VSEVSKYYVSFIKRLTRTHTAHIYVDRFASFSSCFSAVTFLTLYYIAVYVFIKDDEKGVLDYLQKSNAK